MRFIFSRSAPLSKLSLHYSMSIVALAIVFGSLLYVVPAQRGLALNSNNYRIDEDSVGGGGGINATSPNYQSQDNIGQLGVGDSASATKRTQSGAVTTNDPGLSFILNSSSVALGSLSTSLTRTDTTTFSVLNYTSYGYIVQTLGSPPNNGAYTLAGMPTTTTSSVGTEQFGINLVANTSPITYGANPVQNPSTSFSYGAAASGYNSANNYRYVSGETIATATQSSGKTDYTMSYIANIGINTPAGSYSGKQTLVVTGTY